MSDRSAKKLFLQWVRYAVPVAFVASVAGLVLVSAMLTTTAARVEKVAPSLVPEEDVQLRFLVRESDDSPTFEVVFTAHDGETLAELKQRALDEIAAAGLQIVSMV